MVTVFGVSQVAMFGFEGDRLRRRLWRDTVRDDAAFALLDTSPCFMSGGARLFSNERLSPSQYFWLLGHRVVPPASARPWSPGEFLPGGELAEEYARVNRLYTAALPRMHRLRLVKGGTHALWLDKKNAPAVAWVFADCETNFNGTCVNMATGEKTITNEKLNLRAGNVYRLRPAQNKRNTHENILLSHENTLGRARGVRTVPHRVCGQNRVVRGL